MFEKAGKSELLEKKEDIPLSLYYKNSLDEPTSALSKSQLKSRACDLGHKVSEAIFCAFFMDILETIIKLGYDPEIFTKEACMTARSLLPSSYYAQGNRCNYALKLYLADDDDSKEISPFGFIPFQNHVKPSNYEGMKQQKA